MCTHAHTINTLYLHWVQRQLDARAETHVARRDRVELREEVMSIACVTHHTTTGMRVHHIAHASHHTHITRTSSALRCAA
jgi:hypothetical protein